MSVSEQLTFEQIFDRHYDNDNKLCTRRSLLEQFKEVNRELIQQKLNNLPKGLSSDHEIIACAIYKGLLEDLEK